jgi:photosystem II stability/assembly factor-like uncharacterized protein
MARSSKLAFSLASIFALLVATAPADAGRAASLKFHAQSMSWVSPQHGWLLGSADCGTTTCTTTAGTTNGGTSWQRLGGLAAPITNEDQTGVTDVRFADDLHGWAFAPALWATSDGGTTWSPQPLGGGPVMALAADAQVAYVLVSGCAFGSDLSTCRHGATLWRSAPAGSAWTPVSLRLPVASEGTLAVFGSTAYVALATPGSTDGDTIEATTDGSHWSARPDPCDSANDEYLSSVAPSSATQVALLCQGDIGFGFAEKRVLRSSDTGLTTSDAGTLNQYGIISQLTASPNGTLLVSSYSIGSWIYRNAGGQNWTTPEDLGDGGIGWNDITFTTDQLAFVVHGPAGCCGGHGIGEIWKSTDGGVTWRQIAVNPQG